MAKKKKDLDLASSSHLNQIQGSTNAIFNVIFVILALACIIPVVFIFMISISSAHSIKMNGYQFIPSAYSLDSYKFLLREGQMILTALGVSVAVTVIGTVIGVALTMLMGYVLSRSTYKLNGFFTMVVFIPMIFNGGMISSYVVNTQFLNLKNSIWALILPLCVSSFNVVICNRRSNPVPDFRKDRPAAVETADGNDRPVPHLWLLERLVPVFPVHQRYQAVFSAGAAGSRTEKH